MANLFVKAGIAAVVALTALTSTAPIAAASGPDLGIQVQYRERERHDDRYDRRDRHRGCAPWLAEEKASRMGLRRARVVDVNRRVVVVRGIDRRGPDRIFFANERGCPVIRR